MLIVNTLSENMRKQSKKCVLVDLAYLGYLPVEENVHDLSRLLLCSMATQIWTQLIFSL